MTTTIENNRKIYQQLTHGQIAFMSELLEHFKAQKERDIYYISDDDYFDDQEDKIKLPSIDNSQVHTVFDDTWDIITNGRGYLSLNLENFCNYFICFRTFDTQGIDYSLFPYIDYVYRKRGSQEWSDLISYGKKVVESTFNWDAQFVDCSRCTMTILGDETDLTDEDWKKHDAMIADYRAQEKK